MFTNFYEEDLKTKPQDREFLLIERIAAGDENALSQLYDLYSKIVYSLMIKIVKSKEEAEELLQSVFIKIWTKAEVFNSTKGNVYSWIITMARNCAIDRLRSKQFKNSINTNYNIDDTIVIDLSGWDHLDSAIVNERADLVKKALGKIPPEQNEIMELAYFEGMTQTEIAELLKIPLGTVKSRMRQALLKLEKILKPLLN